MKAAYICADAGVPVFGAKGCSVHVQELILALKGAGVQVSLFTNNVDGRRPRILSGIPIHRLQRASGDRVATREVSALALNDSLPSVLNSIGSLDFVYERYSLWSFAGVEWAASRGLPTVVEVNAPLIDEQMAYRQLIHKAEADRVASRLFDAASTIVIVSEVLEKYIRRFSINPRKIHVVANAVNPFRFPRGLDPVLPANPGIFTIGFLGSLKPWHGLSCLLDAFEILYRKDPNTRLVLIGDGPERKSLTEKLANRDLLKAAYFTGMVPPCEVPGFLSSIDVAVAPYPKIENLYFSPLKVFEYMAAGLPVVASAIGQLTEIIENDVTGLLCPPGDTFMLARALERLRQSQDLRTRLGLAARAKVLRNYTWNKNAERILQLVTQTNPPLSMAREA